MPALAPQRPDPPASSFGVDDEGLRFVDGEYGVLDVCFDGRRVWSVDPEDLELDDGFRTVEWPDPIRTRLDGKATVELRDAVTGQPKHSTEQSFGSGEGRVAIVDSKGRAVALTKWGRLGNTFATTGRDEIEGYLDRVEEVLAILRDECGVPAFLSFGTLLGAVREGKLIGHDVDVDLGYFSRHQTPVDVIRESFDIERAMRRRGWRVRRENGGFLALWFPQPDGGSRNLDIFTCLRVGDSVYQVHDVGAVADESAVLPLQEIEFEGRRLPAPARPEVFLEAAYGKTWRIPDPSFTFDTPARTRRRVDGWFAGMRMRRDQWAKFYAAHADEIPRKPTEFARWMAAREELGTLLEVGFGNGRDAIFFAERGFDVHGVELVTGQADKVGRRAKRHGVSIDLYTANLESLRETLSLGCYVADAVKPQVLYGRFLLHSLTESSRERFWRLAAMALSGGGRCYLEFRTDVDRELPKAFGKRPRIFLDPDQVIAEAKARGAHVLHREQGRGLAAFKDEDPDVCRLVLEW